MTDDGANAEDLDAAIAEVFRGPLEEFIGRRDTLVKELRDAGRRDEADSVKRLRKPTRLVWALDAAVLDDRDPVERVAAAVVDMFAAQSGRGDVRDASGELRDAVRDLAAAAARAAAARGHAVDQSALVPAVLAVIGETRAFEALRAGRLVELPDASGLDALAGAPPLAPLRGTPKATPPPPAADPAALAEAEEALDRAEATVATARQRATAADEAVTAAQVAAEAADDRLRLAEADTRAARAQLREAQQAAKAASQQLRAADRTAAQARARLDETTR